MITVPASFNASAIASVIRACLAALLLLVALPSAQAAEASPADMLRGIYREAVKGTTSDWLEPKRRANYLSKSLLALWAKSDAKKVPKGEVGAIDFDITTDTNALELQSFDIKVTSESANAAVLAVKLNYRKPYYRPGPPAVVTYDFIREGAAWRVDNIRTPGWSVRSMLTEWLKG